MLLSFLSIIIIKKKILSYLFLIKLVMAVSQDPIIMENKKIPIYIFHF